jgi:uroporphyrinogen-III synthase
VSKVAPSPAPRPLSGFSVGITADRRWDEQAALFERRGATVVHAPTIRTLPLGDEAALRRATEDVIAHPPDALIANTGLGVRSWLSTADTWGLGLALTTALGRSRIYARGPKASGAVHAAGLPVHARGRTERLSDLTDELIVHLGQGDTVAVQVDGSNETPELARLRAAGARVVVVPVYRWTLPDDLGPALRLAEATISGRVHAVTFTAGPAVRNWLAICAQHDLGAELRRALTGGGVIVGCVGPVCTETAVAEGLLSPHLVRPDAFRLGPLVRAVSDSLTARRVTIVAEPSPLVLSGNALIAGADTLVPLTDTEARLLRALAARPNAVVTKDALLRDVWGPGATDTHTVEVAVARLRKRLGPHGTAVRSVHRRGYMLATSGAPSPRKP